MTSDTDDRQPSEARPSGPAPSRRGGWAPANAFLRWLGDVRILRRAASWLMALYIQLIHRTTRWEFVGRDHREACLAGGGGRIMGFWHNQIFMTPSEKRPELRVIALIAPSRDGQIVADCIARFGIETVFGSSSKTERPDRKYGGSRAALQAYALLSRGKDVLFAITPDGPTGPAFECKDGIATLSIATQAPIFPFAFSTKYGIRIPSWDRFRLPMPFGRGVKAYGAPLLPPKDQTPEAIEAHRAKIGAELTRIAEVARRAASGKTPPDG